MLLPYKCSSSHCCWLLAVSHFVVFFFLFFPLVQEEEGVGLLMTHIADNVVLCSNATLLIILLHNLRLVLTGRFTKWTRYMESVQRHHHNVAIQMSDSALIQKQMSIYRKRGQGERKKERNKGMERTKERERERERRGKRFKYDSVTDIAIELCGGQ